MIKISVVVITYNEERNLARCLESVQNVADEIVVVDSNSKDTTVAIAERFGARVFQHAFEGYGQQKNFATLQATNDWILSLDADEALTPQLEKAILKVKEQPDAAGYQMARLTNYCGAWIKHCGWYPDKKIRLYDRTKGAWTEPRIHEGWVPNDARSRIGDLRAHMLHYSYYTLSDHVSQIEKFTELAAKDAVARGKSCSLMKIWLGPKWNFFANYIMRLGILDGYAGYLICKLTSVSVFIKYSKTRQYARIARKGSL